MRAVAAALETRFGWRRVSLFVLLALVSLSLMACANPQTVLTQLVDARRLASELHLQFTQSAEAANRAVMAEGDDAAAAAADEARRARQVVERDLHALRTNLQSSSYGDDLRHLDDFEARFREYRRLDDEILPLAVENTNLKAQRLSFGAGREAADAFRSALDAAVRSAKDSPRARDLAAAARIAVLEILVLQAPHIAEPRDDAMTRFEEQMKTSAANARKALAGLQGLCAPADAANATAALDRFVAINDQIVALSRRNTNVRSLALALGRKRAVTAECADQLKALEEALAKHEFTATR